MGLDTKAPGRLTVGRNITLTLLSQSRESRESVVPSWETGPSEVVSDSRHLMEAWRRRIPHCCKLFHGSAELNCEIYASKGGQKPLNMEAEYFTALEAVTR
jgi:hypothetical protein